MQLLELGGISVEVMLKDIKNIHLSVYPPTGQVRISAPLRMNLDHIRVYAISRLGWIRQQQRKLLAQPRQTEREYLDRESHFVWGRRYLLRLVEHSGSAAVEPGHKHLVLKMRETALPAERQAVLDAWYREQVKVAAQPLIAKWEPLLGVSVRRLFVQRMRTKWGSCTTERGNIRLNTELAKKPPECLEYVLVHEMAHLLVRHHNDLFTGLLDRWLPNWRLLRQTLNEAPLSHETWGQ